MTDLTIATGRPKEELDTLADSLARSATTAGFTPSQGLQVGARAIGLYGATQAPATTQAQVANISADVINKLARVAPGKQPVELQGDIAAITQALGLGAAGQIRVADLDAYLTRRFGAPSGSTFEALAQSASVGRAAGFSTEQLSSLAALIVSRTGQTPTAVGGYLAQIFSRGGEGSLTNVARAQGIDTSQTLAEQFKDLAQVYAAAEEATQTQISAAFGRGKVQNAVVAALQDYSEVLGAASDAQKNASGTLDDLFGERMRNIGGQLAQLGGAFKDFAQLLGSTGILDALGVTVVGLTELFQTINGVLRVFNDLDANVRRAIIAIALFTLAARNGAIAAGISGAVGGAGAGLAGASAGGLASRGALGAVGLLTNPITLAIGGLIAVGALKNSADELRGAMSAGSAALYDSELTSTATPDEFRTQAEAGAAAARQNREAASGFFANILSYGRGARPADAADRLAGRLEGNVDYLRRVADAIERRQANLPAETSVFTDFSQGGLDTALQDLVAGGANARTQMDLLSQAVRGLGDASKASTDELTRVEPTIFAGRAANPIISALENAIGGFTKPGAVKAGQGGQTFALGLDPQAFLRLTGIDLGSVGSGLEEQLKSFGITSAGQLTPEVMDEIASNLAGSFDYSAYPAPEQKTAVADQVKGVILQALQQQIKDQFGGFLGSRELTSGETLATIRKALTVGQEATAALPQSDYRGRVSLAKQTLDTILAARQRGETDDLTQGQVTDLIAQARRDLAAAQINELEALRQVALRNATSKRQALRASRGFIRQQIDVAVGARDADALANIISAAGKGAIDIAQQAIQAALTAARAAAQTLQAMGRIAGGLVGPAGAILSLAGAGAELGAIAQLQQLSDVLGNTPSGTVDSEISGFGGGGAGAGAESSRAQIAAARAQAFANRDGGQIAAARAAMQSARADMAAAEKGTVEYYNALGAFFSAQQQLTEAIRAHQKNVGLLRIDATNPLQVARLEARLARQKLQQDIRAGRGADVIAQDRVDLRAAQANAEATKFSQRLEAVQTAEELGRISHRKYINYLENEKNRLEAIKNRTYQQQDQLNQIDRLLKDAASEMNAQWNFGDIKLPTPYQVRRYIEAQTGAASARQVAASNSSTAVQNVSFYVNGADTGKVKQIIQDVVGKGARVTTTSTRRR